MKKRTRTVIVVASIAIVLVAAVAGFNILKARRTLLARFDVVPQTEQASQGDIGVYVASSGNLYTDEESTVEAGTIGTVSSVDVQAGQVVEEGQVLATVDGATLSDDIESLEDQIYDKEIAISQVSQSRERLYIKAEAEGTIKDIKAEEDDDVEDVMAKYGYLALLSLQDKEYIVVEASVAGFLTKGAQLEVRRGDTVIDGVVDKIENGNAYVLIETDSFSVGGKAYVYPEGEYSQRVQGKVELYDYLQVKAYRGTVSSVSCSENEEQILGENLFSAYSYYSQTVIDMYNQLDDLKEQLSEKQQMLGNLEIKAPYDGVVTECNLSAGDVISDDGMPAFSIANTSVWEARVSVDELDINNVKPGQKAIVYIDALPDYEFEGTVSDISSVGVAANGVTSYEVGILLYDDQGIFKLNMTMSADIETAYAENAVRIPVEALRESNGLTYVVRYAGRTEAEVDAIRQSLINAAKGAFRLDGNGAGPEGGQALSQEGPQYDLSIADRLYGDVVEIQAGIQNESYVEVISGLNPGDIVILLDDSSDETEAPGMFGLGMLRSGSSSVNEQQPRSGGPAVVSGP